MEQCLFKINRAPSIQCVTNWKRQRKKLNINTLQIDMMN